MRSIYNFKILVGYYKKVRKKVKLTVIDLIYPIHPKYQCNLKSI